MKLENFDIKDNTMEIIINKDGELYIGGFVLLDFPANGIIKLEETIMQFIKNSLKQFYEKNKN